MDTLQSTLGTLSVLDWMLLALLLYSTIRAFLRGFLLEFFSLVGMACGIGIAAWHCSDFAIRLQAWLKPFTELSLPLANLVAFLAILFLAILASHIAGLVLKRAVGVLGLGLFDRAAGALFGLVRGSLLAVAIVLILTAFDPGSRLLADSRLFPSFLAATHALSFVVPERLQQQFSDGIAKTKHRKPPWSN
jgi:membrane protein required for colicin V production